jgi:ribokinase
MPAEEWQEKTYAWFHARGIRNLCITMGKEGSYFASEEGALSVPAFSVKPVDTTAAGDAFHGGLVYGILNNLSMEKTLQIGNACGGLSTLTMGAQNSIQPLETVLSFLREHQIDVSTADSTVYGAERMQ